MRRLPALACLAFFAVCAAMSSVSAETPTRAPQAREDDAGTADALQALVWRLCRHAHPAHAGGNAPDLCQVAFGAP